MLKMEKQNAVVQKSQPDQTIVQLSEMLWFPRGWRGSAGAGWALKDTRSIPLLLQPSLKNLQCQIFYNTPR